MTSKSSSLSVTRGHEHFDFIYMVCKTKAKRRPFHSTNQTEQVQFMTDSTFVSVKFFWLSFRQTNLLNPSPSDEVPLGRFIAIVLYILIIVLAFKVPISLLALIYRRRLRHCHKVLLLIGTFCVTAMHERRNGWLFSRRTTEQISWWHSFWGT